MKFPRGESVTVIGRNMAKGGGYSGIVLSIMEDEGTVFSYKIGKAHVYELYNKTKIRFFR